MRPLRIAIWTLFPARLSLIDPLFFQFFADKVNESDTVPDAPVDDDGPKGVRNRAHKNEQAQ